MAVSSYRNLIVVSLAGVDLTAAASSKIFTTDAGLRFIPTQVVAEITTADTIAVAPTISVGTNAATYNDILTASALTGLTAVNKMLGFGLTAAAGTSVAASVDIYVKVTTGATAVACVGRIDVIGYYQP